MFVDPSMSSQSEWNSDPGVPAVCSRALVVMGGSCTASVGPAECDDIHCSFEFSAL